MSEKFFLPEHPWIEKIHQGPELADAVFDGCAGQCDPKTTVLFRAGQVTGGLALLCGGVFDRLRFIDHETLPIVTFKQFAVALQQAIAGEHKIHILQRLLQCCWGAGAFWTVVLMHIELGSECCGLPLPIGEHGCRCD